MPGGLLALPRDGSPSALDVYDLKQNRWVYRGPDEAVVPPTSKHPDHRWMLSLSGRTASNGFGSWDLATGRQLWQASPHEVASPNLDGRIFVIEQWSDYWKKWLPSHTFETSAWRDMDSGVLLYRTTLPEASAPQKMNASRTLAVAHDGAVYRLPPRINWSLLVLCEAVLGLPIVLVWVVLRFRRRRGMMRQQAEAAP
jgi:hypothetical protein